MAGRRWRSRRRRQRGSPNPSQNGGAAWTCTDQLLGSMRRVGQRLGPRLLRAGLAAPVARSLEAGPSISGAAAASYVGCSAAWNSRGFAADGGGGGGSDDARAARRRSEAWEEVGRLSEAASEIADDRGSAEARKKLKEGGWWSGCLLAACLEAGVAAPRPAQMVPGRSPFSGQCVALPTKLHLAARTT